MITSELGGGPPSALARRGAPPGGSAIACSMTRRPGPASKQELLPRRAQLESQTHSQGAGQLPAASRKLHFPTEPSSVAKARFSPPPSARWLPWGGGGLTPAPGCSDQQRMRGDLSAAEPRGEKSGCFHCMKEGRVLAGRSTCPPRPFPLSPILPSANGTQDGRADGTPLHDHESANERQNR